jgi:hypothetical protein
MQSARARQINEELCASARRGEGHMNFAYALGRIFVPIVFIWEAILKLINIGRFTKLLDDSKVPMPDEIAPYLGGMPKYEALAWALAVLEWFAAL